jgi:hypothetical protein
MENEAQALEKEKRLSTMGNRSKQFLEEKEEAKKDALEIMSKEEQFVQNCKN